MVTKLSDGLAELSVAVRKAEDAAAKAQKETGEKIQRMRDDAHADAQKRIANFDAKLAADKAEATTVLETWRSKVKADIGAVRERFEQRRQEVDAKHKQRRADRLENDAAYAVEYAVFSIEVAQAAILDAIYAQVDAAAAATK